MLCAGVSISSLLVFNSFLWFDHAYNHDESRFYGTDAELEDDMMGSRRFAEVSSGYIITDDKPLCVRCIG